MNFLKLLADGIHHAHWKSQADFAEIAAPFLPPGAKADLALADDIHSILFLDSLCVIEKRAAGESARLGERVIAGEKAAVEPSPLMLRAGMHLARSRKP